MKPCRDRREFPRRKEAGDGIERIWLSPDLEPRVHLLAASRINLELFAMPTEIVPDSAASCEIIHKIVGIEPVVRPPPRVIYFAFNTYGCVGELRKQSMA
jgi:hypothetical protein